MNAIATKEPAMIFGRTPTEMAPEGKPATELVVIEAPKETKTSLTLIEVAMMLGIFSFVIAGALMFFAPAEDHRTAERVPQTRTISASAVAAAPVMQVAPPVVSTTSPAAPQTSAPSQDKTTIEAIAEDFDQQNAEIGKLTVAGGVIGGIVMFATGLIKLKQASETDIISYDEEGREGVNPDRTPYREGAWRIVVGAGLAAIPAITGLSAVPMPAADPASSARTTQAQYASIPQKVPVVKDVNIGLHDLADRLDAMTLDQNCPTTEDFTSQACGTVGQYLVHRDADGTVSVSLMTRTAGGRPIQNEVMRIVGHEPYLSNEIAPKDMDKVKAELIRTFLPN